MLEHEAKQFFKVAFAAYPGIPQWAKEHSSDFGMTLATWARTLSTTPFDEAIEVINGWVDGTIAEPPVGYKRETFALQVKAIAAQRKFEATKHLREEEEWRSANRGKYQRPKNMVLLAPYLNRIFSEQAKYRNGEITEYELEENTNSIVEEAFPNATT